MREWAKRKRQWCRIPPPPGGYQALRFAARMVRIDFGPSTPPFRFQKERQIILSLAKRGVLQIVPHQKKGNARDGSPGGWQTTIVEIEAPAIIHRMADNVVVASPLGVEKGLRSAARRMVEGFWRAKLLACRAGEERKVWKNDVFLPLAMGPKAPIQKECA